MKGAAMSRAVEKFVPLATMSVVKRAAVIVVRVCEQEATVRWKGTVQTIYYQL